MSILKLEPLTETEVKLLRLANGDDVTDINMNWNMKFGPAFEHLKNNGFLNVGDNFEFSITEKGQDFLRKLR